MKNLLFLNGEYPHTVDIIRILKKYENDLIVHVLIKQKNFHCRSKYIDVFHFLQDNQNIIEFVYLLQEKYDFDMIFPVGFPEVEIFAKEKERFKNIFVENYDIVDKAISKIETLKIAEKLGIPVPKSIVLHSKKDFLKLEKNGFHLPLFVKSFKEMEGRIRGIARKHIQLVELCNKTFKAGSKPLIQEFINDPFTYGVGVLAEKGEIKKCFIHKELLSYPPAGGSGVILTTFNDKQLISYSEKLIDFLNYTGFALVEFKYDSRINDYVLMEINAKFWASIDFALALKPDLFPSINSDNKLSNNHIYLFPDRLVSTSRYAPFKTMKWFFHFLFFWGKRKINFNFKDFKYEMCKIIICFGTYLPSSIKKLIKNE